MPFHSCPKAYLEESFILYFEHPIPGPIYREEMNNIESSCVRACMILMRGNTSRNIYISQNFKIFKMVYNQ